MPHEHPTFSPVHQGPLVLVVDDNLRDRIEVTRMVRGFGYPVRACRHGREALRVIRTSRSQVRALVADLGMHGMDGGELAERAKDLHPGVQVVLLADPGNQRAADLLAGYRDLPILTKPVRHSELYSVLTILVGMPAEARIPASLRVGGGQRRKNVGR